MPSSSRAGACLSELTEFLFLGSFAGCKELDQHGISYILNMARDIDEEWYEMHNIDISNYNYFKVSLRDDYTESIGVYFDHCFEVIEEARKNNEKIIVHCIAGVSRSATICIAYLMKHSQMTLKEAHAFVKAARPVIQPNFNFWQQLMQYELVLYGTNSVEAYPGYRWLPETAKEPASALHGLVNRSAGGVQRRLKRNWKRQPLVVGACVFLGALILSFCTLYM